MNYARQYPRFWLGYFVLSVLLFITNSMYSLAEAFSPKGSPSLFGTTFALIGLWPLFGYVRQRRYNPRWLWLGVFWLSVLGAVVATVICLVTAGLSLSVLPLAIAAAALLLSAPYIFALHQYLFRSPHLWQ
ncbi:hypothetical protein [Piscinibacter sp.]|uniref:hypothetical protein n=1 Tax=Piscinibacter sp. TaxID=1903157 RepID=UPI0039E41837